MPLTEILLGMESQGLQLGLGSGSLHVFPPTLKYMWATLISSVAKN